MDDTRDLKGANLFTIGFAFELSLIVVAAIIGYSVKGSPFPFDLKLFDPKWTLLGIFWGLVGTIVPALFAIFATSPVGARVPPLRRIYDRVKSRLGQPLIELSNSEVMLLAAAAGLGEEILFRGVLQPIAGIVITSLLFGLLHALSVTYFLLATLMSFYFGWLYEATDQNLLAPIVVHWLYDAVALFLFRRRFKADVAAEREAAEATSATANQDVQDSAESTDRSDD